MIRFNYEPLTPELVGAITPMLQAHYEELTFNKDMVKLDPKWEEYFILQAAGVLRTFFARDDSGRLVGYNFFFVNTHMHYGSLTLAVNDVFYLHPDVRRGPAAYRFLRWTREALRELVPSGRPLKIAYHVKEGNNFGAILQRLGYRYEEGVFAELL